MKKNAIDQMFTAAVAFMSDKYGRGFNIHLEEKILPEYKVRPNYIAGVKTGNRTVPEGKKRAIVAGINALMGEAFSYQSFLDLGRRLLVDGASDQGTTQQSLLLMPSVDWRYGHCVEIPVITFAKAGQWDERGPVEEELDVFAEKIAVSMGVGSRSFAVYVTSPSMQPEFYEGDIIIVDPDSPVEGGDFCLAKKENEEATLKKYVKDGGDSFLVNLNSDWGVPENITGKNWKLIGRVVGKRKTY